MPACRSFWDEPLSDLLTRLEATAAGLTSREAELRFRRDGPNSMVREARFAPLRAFLKLFANPLVIILVLASAISMTLGDTAGGIIIIAIVLLSVFLNFFMEHQASRAVDEITKKVATTAAVMRDGTEHEIPIAQVVRGDIIKLRAGDLVPADARLLSEKDLQVRESALTGESLPVEKAARDLAVGTHDMGEACNCIFLGTAVQTGIATAVVVATGPNTAFGAIAARLAATPPETEFDRGIRNFGVMITRVIMALVLFVLLVNVLLHRPLLESFLFSVALAVGMTPEMMPMIITITLAQGARRMAAKQVLIKQLAAIEDFGSLTILCSDKTGTLTEGEIVLDRHVNIAGSDDDEVLRLIYVNSYFQAGIRSPLDDAVLKHERPAILDYTKIDEIPFDFRRKRLSVIAQQGHEVLLVTKGEAESVFGVCTTVLSEGIKKPFDDTSRALATATYQRLSGEGYRVLGVAMRAVEKQSAHEIGEEHEMTLAGFAAFLDPPKEGVSAVLDELRRNGVSVVVMTGDNQYVTRKVALDVGLPVDTILTGSDTDGMDDAALAWQAERGAMFCRVTPEQKNRIILALKASGHVVGFIGDGINDAPSLHTADVGISVMNGVDVAKDAARVILLEKDLCVLNDGIVEGRRSFANIMKYVMMGTSSNFGNMFSMAGATLVLPFLPMLPVQILVNNFLYDVSEVPIPLDSVDSEYLTGPRHWNLSFIRNFMISVGLVSSLFDFLTFYVMRHVFHAGEQLFHT
ncbi:MAG TPA: magnesium-translocating P-type ATPase, partial [Bryobacteraceae bacterium]|nr:magnesium-translocating P-type ATPase [Bryobacteraceae bacterium]